MQTKLLLALVATLASIVVAVPLPTLPEKRSVEALEILDPVSSKGLAEAEEDVKMVLYPVPSKRSPTEEAEMLYPVPSKRSAEAEDDVKMVLYPVPSKRSADADLSADFADK